MTLCQRTLTFHHDSWKENLTSRCRAADERAQQACARGIRTRIRSGALPPGAGRAPRADNSAAPPAPMGMQLPAGSKAAISVSYSVHACAADPLAAAEEPARSARQPARATAAARTDTARADAAESCKANRAVHSAPVDGRAEIAAAAADSADATGQRRSMASRLRSARAAVRRVGGLLRSGQPAAAAGQGRLHASVQELGAGPTAEGPPAAAVDGSADKAAQHGTAHRGAAAEEPPKAIPAGL